MFAFSVHWRESRSERQKYEIGTFYCPFRLIDPISYLSATLSCFQPVGPKQEVLVDHRSENSIKALNAQVPFFSKCKGKIVYIYVTSYVFRKNGKKSGSKVTESNKRSVTQALKLENA